MARANRDLSISREIPLSTLFTDPMVRDAFRRAEEGNSLAFALSPVRPCTLDGGAIAEVTREVELV